MFYKGIFVFLIFFQGILFSSELKLIPEEVPEVSSEDVPETFEFFLIPKDVEQENKFFLLPEISKNLKKKKREDKKNLQKKDETEQSTVDPLERKSDAFHSFLPPSFVDSKWKKSKEEKREHAYRVKKFQIVYKTAHQSHIPLQELMQEKIPLSFTEGVYQVGNAKTFQLGMFNAEGKEAWFDAEALKKIAEFLVEDYHSKGFYGVDVRVDDKQIGGKGEDLRLGSKELSFVVRAARVKKVHTVGQDRKGQKAWNLPRHERIKQRAPIDSSREEGNFFNKEQLEEYLFYLNRHPGRRIDLTMKPLLDEEVGLEFAIQENRPWFFWFNVANTGVKQTNKYVESFGYVNQQFSNRDDILRLFYSTAGFEQIHAFFLTYDAPFFSVERTRWAVEVGYNKFISTEFGTIGKVFSGEQVPLTGKLFWTMFQKRNFFIDLVPALEYKHIRVSNPVNALLERSEIGVQNFLYAKLFIEAQKKEETYSLFLSLGGEVNPRLSMDSNRKEIDFLGRVNTSHNWSILRGDLLFSFYLDPLIMKRERPSLIHEFAVRARGSYAFDYRLIPQEKAVLGGFNTVRGYRESIVSGDQYYLFSTEYLCHLPRLFLSPSPNPIQRHFFGRSFQFRPRYSGGRSDWDLILRIFMDAGRVTNNKRRSYEIDATLCGVGAGLEWIFLENVMIRGDWGLRVDSVPPLGYRAGESRGYLSITVLF